MSLSFKNWLKSESQAIGSTGKSDLPTGVAKAAGKVAQSFLTQDANASDVAKIVGKTNNTSNLIKLGAQAVETAPNSDAKGTNALQVASAIQKTAAQTKLKMNKK